MLFGQRRGQRYNIQNRQIELHNIFFKKKILRAPKKKKKRIGNFFAKRTYKVLDKKHERQHVQETN